MVFCLFIFSAISAESLACPQCHNPLEIDWRYFSLSTQKKIVQDYVYALDSFAIAMPIVGGDAESTWAGSLGDRYLSYSSLIPKHLSL